MAEIEFKTSRGTVVKMRDFLPRRYAKRQSQEMLKGQTVGSFLSEDEIREAQASGDKAEALNKAMNSIDISKLDISAVVDSSDIIVEGMVLSVDGVATDIMNRLGDLPGYEYDEISAKCEELASATPPLVEKNTPQ